MTKFTVIHLLATFALTFNDINAAGEFDVLYCPAALKFIESSNTFESPLKDIIYASFGLSVDENTEWKGLYIADPFNTPEAVVGVYIDGVSSLAYNDTPIKKFSLTVDENEPDFYESIQHRIKQKYPSGGSIFLNLELSDYKKLNTKAVLDLFGEIKVGRGNRLSPEYLKDSVKEDNNFLNELVPLKVIAARVWAGAIKPDTILDYYNFHFSSLHALSEFHGPNSQQTKEAKYFLNQALKELNRAFVKAYNGSVLVAVIVTNVVHKRTVRSPDDEEAPNPTPAPEDTTTIATEEPSPTPNDKDQGENNTGDEFNPDYPAIFNIILWLGVAYLFTMVAIVYAMMDMDPGRDSIIYRMTSAKVKKDN